MRRGQHRLVSPNDSGRRLPRRPTGDTSTMPQYCIPKKGTSRSPAPSRSGSPCRVKEGDNSPAFGAGDGKVGVYRRKPSLSRGVSPSLIGLGNLQSELEAHPTPALTSQIGSSEKRMTEDTGYQSQRPSARRPLRSTDKSTESSSRSLVLDAKHKEAFGRQRDQNKATITRLTHGMESDRAKERPSLQSTSSLSHRSLSYYAQRLHEPARSRSADRLSAGRRDVSRREGDESAGKMEAKPGEGFKGLRSRGLSFSAAVREYDSSGFIMPISCLTCHRPTGLLTPPSARTQHHHHHHTPLTHPPPPHPYTLHRRNRNQHCHQPPSTMKPATPRLITSLPSSASATVELSGLLFSGLQLIGPSSAEASFDRQIPARLRAATLSSSASSSASQSAGVASTVTSSSSASHRRQAVTELAFIHPNSRRGDTGPKPTSGQGSRGEPSFLESSSSVVSCGQKQAHIEAHALTSTPTSMSASLASSSPYVRPPSSRQLVRGMPPPSPKPRRLGHSTTLYRGFSRVTSEPDDAGH
ncbi:unnamed protein product [Protopolystoma xenopodis]|uniref:Uncharacterized protein n=1 Tax=Protopolystoma xenopodis TaxID=117903 RepID=A0A3S4ZRC3_9PLAT|nr:unnamed protein product [Protopolystoma xenopodis]